MDLKDAINSYFDENAALRDWSKRTVSSYRYRIQTFVRFLDDPEVDVSAVLTYDNTARYFNWLSQRGYKDTTLYAKKQASALSGTGVTKKSSLTKPSTSA